MALALASCGSGGCDSLSRVPAETSGSVAPPAPTTQPATEVATSPLSTQEAATEGPSGAAGEPSSPPAPKGLPPLTAPGALVELPVEGHAPAVLAVPLGATRPRPVVLATHGNFDRPEWQCQVWREIVGPEVFVLCPRGKARGDSPAPDDTRFTYANNQALEKEIRAGLDALRALYPEHVAEGPVVYTGFSLGAIMGVAIMGRDPAQFPRMILVEGGSEKLTAGAVSAFAKAGGQRVLFGCGQGGCVGSSNAAARLLEKAGVAARVVHGKGVGHSYDGAVATEVAGAFGWLVEGDARFAPSVAP
ncbi:hypothetical protein [Chondromyces crocatus]|nr:hypothetical protein [Chondromyces crocatus]